jgi:2-keto-4-pentenoate hydratase/2-oxohepta-3-ene-1,7-dioic acid hydratase in catechol pathway
MEKSVGTIFCIGRNYADHAKELGNEVPSSPIVFLKAAASLRGLAPIPMGFDDASYHFEAEIVTRVSRPVALHSGGSWEDIKEITLGIDLTRREIQNELKKKGLPWTTAKSFQGSAIVGGFIPTDKFQCLDEIEFSFLLNDELKQRGNSRQMLFSVPQIISYLASFTSLNENDLIFTGTPQGVGPIKKGDRFEMRFAEFDRGMKGVL